jgi:hypothetical protein
MNRMRTTETVEEVSSLLGGSARWAVQRASTLRWRIRERGVEIGKHLTKACRTVRGKENAEKRPALVADRKSYRKCPLKVNFSDL